MVRYPVTEPPEPKFYTHTLRAEDSIYFLLRERILRRRFEPGLSFSHDGCYAELSTPIFRGIGFTFVFRVEDIKLRVFPHLYLDPSSTYIWIEPHMLMPLYPKFIPELIILLHEAEATCFEPVPINLAESIVVPRMEYIKLAKLFGKPILYSLPPSPLRDWMRDVLERGRKIWLREGYYEYRRFRMKACSAYNKAICRFYGIDYQKALGSFLEWLKRRRMSEKEIEHIKEHLA